MADKGGADLELDVAHLEVQIQQQLLNIKSNSYRKVQIQRELGQLDENNAAATKHIKELEAQLKETKERIENG